MNERRFSFGPVPALIAALLLVGPGTAAAKDQAPKPDEPTTAAPGEEAPPIMMQPFQVSEKPPKLCFGMSLSVWTDSITKAITAIYVTNVKPGSDAEKYGLGLYTRILAIDGKPVEQMEPSFRHGTDLNRAFVNREVGDKMTLTVLPTGAIAPVTVHLVNKSGRYTKIDFLAGR